jgi:hypothetical protein
VFAPRHRVAWKAHTPAAVRHTLEQNAVWLRRLMPLLLNPDRDDLISQAGHRRVDRAGNPIPRRRGIAWKYP